MTAPLKAVFFDLGDTLLNFAGSNYNQLFAQGASLAYKYLQNQGLRLPSEKKYLWMHWLAIRTNLIKSFFTRREFNAADVMQECCGKLKIPQNKNMVLELCWQFYIPVMKTAYVEESLKQVIRDLKALNLDICIVSNTFVPGETLDRHLNSEGLLELFPDRIYSCDIGIRKPNRGIFTAACERMKVNPDQVMFVGDKPQYDIKGANRMGMISVLKDPAGKYRKPRFKPTHKVEKLLELPEICKQYL